MSDTSSLLTPICILASNPKYLTNLSVDRENPSKEGKYYARIALTAENLKEPAWKRVQAEIVRVGTEKFGDKFSAMLAEGAIRNPIRKDLVSKGFEPDQFAAFLNLNAYADNKPALVDRDGTPLRSIDLLQVGCKVRASLYVRAYHHTASGNKGITLGLRGLQYAGPVVPGLTIPVGGRGDGSNDFGALPGVEKAEDGGEDDLSKLLG